MPFPISYAHHEAHIYELFELVFLSDVGFYLFAPWYRSLTMSHDVHKDKV